MPPKSELVAAVMGDTTPLIQTNPKKHPNPSIPRTTTTKSSNPAKPGSRARPSKKLSLPPPSELASDPTPKPRVRQKSNLLPKQNWDSTAPISKTPTHPVMAKGGVKNKSLLQQKPLGEKKQAIPKTTEQPDQQSRQAGYMKEKFTERWMSVKTLRFKDAERREKVVARRNDETERKGLEGLGRRKENEKEERKTFDWNGLTPEIQKRIIRHWVVDPRFLIWPEKRSGREQPDLGLVSREVREQVLEVVYGENAFGVSINSARAGSVGKEDCWLSGLAAVQKWATVLDERWFGRIRNWCFEYEDPKGGGAKLWRAGFEDGEEEDESFVVSVQFPERGNEQRVSFSGPTVEIHRAACCVLPGSEEFGQCVVRHTPMRLNGLIIGAMGEGWRLQADALEGLVKSLRDRDLIELVAEARCEPAMVKMRKRHGAISM
ncbi:uncharacterized protein MYCFIDRAFT_214472 [Pseudocercospora fijiensis CIRAD86]|uniref:Uncharacterized protein n=1 Tax=Pseudocercospora fijiensis (strain CIRAD86) TaxID=383855 RepID=M3BCR8_PSEFD|nr:uncharacterized protein MYCFIDRAFT_214472 [Pseudocercospora fijiensis CIRAD86]EME87072.1 hypothetical protein MYCFIDRAFT_214472 [Pseudocercospora fijiensis CIRAD86]